jgi:hypothetical protein
LEEANIHIKCDNPNIVKLFGTITSDQHAYFILEVLYNYLNTLKILVLRMRPYPVFRDCITKDLKWKFYGTPATLNTLRNSVPTLRRNNPPRFEAWKLDAQISSWRVWQFIRKVQIKLGVHCFRGGLNTTILLSQDHRFWCQ